MERELRGNAGGQPFSDLRAAHAGVENVVALCDVDWARGAGGFAAFPNAADLKTGDEIHDPVAGVFDSAISHQGERIALSEYRRQR